MADIDKKIQSIEAKLVPIHLLDPLPESDGSESFPVTKLVNGVYRDYKLPLVPIEVIPNQSSSAGEITLSNPQQLTELNAVANPVTGKQLLVNNYLNDRVIFKYDGTNWIRKSNLNIACVVRLNETTSPPTWELIDDAAHVPIGVTGVTNYADGAQFNFAITYPEVDKVGAIVSTNDESYSRQGLFHGASVGNTNSYFQVFKQNLVGRMIISGATGLPLFANDSGDTVGDELVGTWNASTSRIDVTFPLIGIVNIDRNPIVVSNTQTVRAVVVSSSSSGFSVEFYNRSDNSKLTSLTSLMKFELFMNGSWQVRNTILSDEGNIWITGTMLHE
tara:strand:- start:960 stop:1955 length:996 start_codon:yes stop_codon:yes gene_type:complete